MSWRKALFDARVAKPASVSEEDWKPQLNSDTVPRAQLWMRDHGSTADKPTFRNFPLARYMHHCYGDTVAMAIKLSPWDWFVVLLVFLAQKGTSLLIRHVTAAAYHGEAAAGDHHLVRSWMTGREHRGLGE